MIRRIVAGMIAIGLGLGIWALWPRGETTPSTTTRGPVADQTTTTINPAPPTTSSGGSTTTTTVESHVVETVEEAEEILRELWFGWFEGIYNQDEDRIREVVATQELLNSATDAFESMEFVSPPHPSGITLPELEILRGDERCFAVWSQIRATFREGSSEGVQVVRWMGDRWALASIWTHKEDLWDADCETQLQPLP